MIPIIAIYDAKILVIIILILIIVAFVFIKIIVVSAYYRGVSDTRKTMNGVMQSDISSYKKLRNANP